MAATPSPADPSPSPGTPRFGAAGRAAKLLPPSDPPGTLERPELERRLEQGVERRLTVVVAGAGFGKSTLAAHVAARHRSAWYTLDGSDRQLGTLVAGVVAALRHPLPDLPADLAAPVEGSIEVSDEAEILGRAQAAAALVGDALQDAIDGDVLLVLDDLHAIEDSPIAWRFVEALVRLAPPELHLLVTSRNELPFGVERLRGQGQVLDLGGATLAFSAPEIGRVIVAVLDDDDLDDEARVRRRRARPARDRWLAGGRPSRPGGLPRRPGRAPRPGPRPAAASRRPAVRLPRRGGRGPGQRGDPRPDRPGRPLRPLLGAPVRGHRQPRRGGDPRPDGASGAVPAVAPGRRWLVCACTAWSASSPSAGWPCRPTRSGPSRPARPTWFESEGLLEAALDARLLADDPTALAAFLSDHAPALVLGGATRKVIDATARVPVAERTARLERAVGEAHLVRGDWREAYAAFDRAAGKRGHLDAATAWRMGLIHGLRGAYGEALEVYAKAVVDGSQPADEAMLDAWIASAHYHRGEVAASRASAERALQLAQAAGRRAGPRRGLDGHRHEPRPRPPPGSRPPGLRVRAGLGRARRRHAPGRAHPLGDGRPGPRGRALP